MEKIRTTGIIRDRIIKDGGYVNYLVDVELNGEIVRARSIAYDGKYLPYDKIVTVDYYESPNGINKIVEIMNENIVACSANIGKDLKVLKWFGIAVIVVIIIFLIKSLL